MSSNLLLVPVITVTKKSDRKASVNLKNINLFGDKKKSKELNLRVNDSDEHSSEWKPRGSIISSITNALSAKIGDKLKE